MPRGGVRPNAGRKQGQTSKMTMRMREEAAASGQLPHEWLLQISRGGAIKQHRLVITYKRGKEVSREWIEDDYYPCFSDRMDAAKAAAAYYAPRLAAQVVKLDDDKTKTMAQFLEALAGKLPV